MGSMVSISMAIVALTSPIPGAIADHAGDRRLFFITTYLSAGATGLMATVQPGDDGLGIGPGHGGI